MDELSSTSTASRTPDQMRDGDDFVCPNCGCEIMLKHHGDITKMPRIMRFTCCCGTPMEFEHPEG